MWELLERLFGGGFMPHGHCYLWTPAMVWAQVSSNALIGLAYLSISATLAYLVRRVKLPFSWVYIAFGVFILACGFTHLLDVATVWHPIYWVDAGVRIVTAIASIGTAILVVPLVPKVLAVAKLSEVARERGERLESLVQELTDANEQLRREQDERARLSAENATLQERAKVHEFQERFVAILGHDLRNPLAAIEMGVSLLRRSADGKEVETLNRIDASSTRMSRMIAQILDLTRSRLGGGFELRPVAVDVGELLTAVADELRMSSAPDTILLRCPPGVTGTWDRDRLEQVFSNLVGNALSHGLAGKPVTIDVTDGDAAVTITVHNQGPPIPAGLRAALFDPFRRGFRDSRTAQTSGLGLGLFISREIVTKHGGTLDVESGDEGTTFRVTLPRIASAGPASRQPQ